MEHPRLPRFILKLAQRKLFAKGMINLANIIAGALVFGQLVSSVSLRVHIFVLGILIVCFFYVVAYKFSKEIYEK